MVLLNINIVQESNDFGGRNTKVQLSNSSRKQNSSKTENEWQIKVDQRIEWMQDKHIKGNDEIRR